MTLRRDTAGPAALWVMALGLMTWDTLSPGPLGEIGAWALLTSCGAAVWTLAAVIRHCRRVILEVMAWEHWQMSNDDGRELRRGNVRALRQR